MDLRKQFEKETKLEAVIEGWYPTVELARPEYTEWLEHRLSTIVQQSLSGSEAKASTPKCSHPEGAAYKVKSLNGRTFCRVCGIEL